MIFNAIGAVLSIFIMIGIGVFVLNRKWITREHASVFSKIVVNIAVPANILYGALTIFEKEQLIASAKFILIGFAAMILTYAIAWFLGPVIGISKSRRGVFSVLFAFSNSVFIGFPVANALFGDAGMSFAVMFFFVNTTVFWTLGYMGIRRDAQIAGGEVEKTSFWNILKRIINVPLLFIGYGLVMLIMEWTLPAFIVRVLGYLSGLTTPLSLLFTGIVLADIGFKNLGFEWDILKVLAGRVLIAPAMMLLMTILFHADGLGQQVFVVQATLPVMLQAVILSEYYHSDSAFATKSFAWTTLISLVTIPLYMVLVNVIF